jgi:hypothetical protein
MEYDNNHFIIASRAYSLHSSHWRTVVEAKLGRCPLPKMKFSFTSYASSARQQIQSSFSSSSTIETNRQRSQLLVRSLPWRAHPISSTSIHLLAHRSFSLALPCRNVLLLCPIARARCPAPLPAWTPDVRRQRLGHIFAPQFRFFSVIIGMH